MEMGSVVECGKCCLFAARPGKSDRGIDKCPDLAGSPECFGRW